MIKRVERGQDLQVNITIKEKCKLFKDAYLDYILLYTDNKDNGYKINHRQIAETGKVSFFVNYKNGLDRLDKGQLKIMVKFYVGDVRFIEDDTANYTKEFSTNIYLNY